MKSFSILCNQQTEHEPIYQKLKRFKSCFFISANMDVSLEESNEVYGRNYFYGREYLNYLEEKKALQKNFSKWIKILKRFAPDGKLFEIGSAYGFFLEIASSYWEVKGVDISQHACEYGKSQGFNVECGDFLDLPVEIARYNIFCV